MTIWLALIAVLPAWAVLNIPFSLGVKVLPRPARMLLGIVVGTPVIVAIFTPHPLTSLVAAFAHATIVCGLVGLGTRYAEDSGFWPIAWGLLATIFIAMLYTLWTHESRLTHPIWAATSIGLGGTLLSILAVHLSIATWLRLGMAITGIVTVFWSGSRGALLALLVALTVSNLRRQRHYVVLSSSFVLVALISTLLIGGRWLSSADGGRELLWTNTRTVVQNHLLTGVGRWELGTYIWPEKKCVWWQELEMRGIRCQDNLGMAQPQVIAHNAALQSMGETGILGASLEFLLIGVTLALALRAERSVVFAVIITVAVMGLTDTPLFLPGPFGGVIAYFMIGSVLGHTPLGRRELVLGSIIGIVILGLTLIPPIAAWTRVDSRPIRVHIIGVGLDRSKRYHDIRFDFIAPPGRYQVDLLACKVTCSQLRKISVKGGQKNVLMQVGPPSFPTNLVLRVLNDSGLRPRELRRWAVPRFGEFSALPTN